MENLSQEQQEAFNIIKSGENIFITGPGGTGKSFLIKKIVEWSKIENKNIQVCAMTGCAALLLECGAKTIHSWGGIGLANGPLDELISRVSKHKYKKVPWKKIDILIIDEVSMMSKKIFELLDGIARQVRKKPLHPFGGIQIIFTGDFYQLPPVGNNNEPETCEFCFESKKWNECITNIIELKTIFRQTDNVYANVLNQIRIGKLKKSGYNLLCSRVSMTYDDIIKPTRILPLRRQADKINSTEFSKLSEAEERNYQIENIIEETDKIFNIKRNIDQQLIEQEYESMKNNIMADKNIILKIGAQVMCIANIDMDGPAPISNGSQGIIESFIGDLPLVRFTNGQKRIIGYHIWNSEKYPWIGVKQLPLIYSWAITIHKAQGVTLEIAEIDAGHNIFECGQTYVALSRVKSIEGLYLTAFDPEKIKINKKVQDFYNSLS